MTADTFSNTLGFLIMGTGNDNNSWGTNANSFVFQIFEDAIANALTSSVTGGTLDLSGSPPPAAASQARYAVLIFNGTLASNQTIKVPNLTKFWWVNNQTSGAFTLQIQTPSGTGVLIPQNSGWQLVSCDAANDIIVSPFNSQQIQMPDGSAAAPPFSDVNETNSGWYRHGSGDWRLSIQGVDILQVTGSIVNVLNGSLQQAGVQIVPPGTEFDFAGVSVPAGFIIEVGQQVSRTTFANLKAALTGTFTCTFSNGSPTLSSVSLDLRNLGLENAVLECSAPGITNLTISSITSNTITMSGNATANSGGTVTVTAYTFGNVDGSTTFTLPDRRGVVTAGRDNMGSAGSAAAGRLTTAGSGVNGISLGTLAGAQNQSVTIAQANLPNVNLSVSSITLTDPGHLHALSPSVFSTSGSLNINTSGGGALNPISQTQSATTGITLGGHVPLGGSGTAITITTVQPTGITNKIIKT